MRNMIVCIVLALPISQFALADESAPAAEQQHQAGIKEGLTRLLLTDNSFVSKAATTSLAEIELSKLAISKSKDPAILAFARRMVKDHTAASKELQRIASSKGIEVPKELDDNSKEAAKKLVTLSGADFDNTFRAQMEKDHDKAVSLFTAAADDKSIAPELSAFAHKVLPVLRDHQHDVQKLQKDARVSTAQ